MHHKMQQNYISYMFMDIWGSTALSFSEEVISIHPERLGKTHSGECTSHNHAIKFSSLTWSFLFPKYSLYSRQWQECCTVERWQHCG